MVNHPNRNRLSTTKKLRVQFDYQEGWYWDHPSEPDYTALIKWPPGKTLREAIAPRCRELGVDAATAASTMVTRTWHLGEDVKRNLSYVCLYIGTEEQRGVIMRLVFEYETLLPHILKTADDDILEMTGELTSAED